eukprot:58372_1
MATVGNIDRYPLEIINAGMYRGGTSSLSLALQELGFGPTWHLVTNSQETNDVGSKWWIENKVVDKLHNNEYVDFDDFLQRIQCRTVMDSPIAFYWDKLFAQYPKSKVIISVRDFESWSKSYTNLLTTFVDPAMKICTMTDAWTNELMRHWNNNHIGAGYGCMSEFLALGDSKRDMILKQKYLDKHIDKAKEMVPKAQLLIFNPKEGWAPLCQFLNVAVPNTPYPNINNTKELNAFVYQWKKNRILSMINVYYVVVPFVVLIACLVLY